MTSTTLPQATLYRNAQSEAYPVSSKRFDRAVAWTSLWFIAGMFLDGWAHNHLDSSLETFFTPWHGVLYAGFLAVASVLILGQARNMARGYDWRRALPHGYGLALVGAGLFSLGGVGDLIWHTLFGIEANAEALFSPTHLLLATGGMLFITGPLRAAWLRSPLERNLGWGGLFPAILSLLMVFLHLSFFSQYAHPMRDPALLIDRPAGVTYLADLYGITSALLPTVVLMGLLLLALRRWDLPYGALTLLLTVSSALMWALRYNQNSQFWALLVAALAAGLLGDLLLIWLKPSALRMDALRLFAFSLPFALVLCNHLALLATHDLWWQIHMWLGVPFMAGVVGLLLSFVAYPPALADERS